MSGYTVEYYEVINMEVIRLLERELNVDTDNTLEYLTERLRVIAKENNVQMDNVLIRWVG